MNVAEMAAAGGSPVLSGGAPWPAAARPDADRSLVDRVAGQDPEALRVLYERHGAALLRYATALTGDAELAQETVQDTLVAVWRGAAAFRGESSVRTWLFGIARRRALSALSRPALAEPYPDATDLLEQVAGGAADDPVRRVLARAELAEVVAAVRKLPPHHREVLVLAWLDGMSAPEIAAVVGIPNGTVRSRLSLARRALADAIETEETRDA